MKISFHKQFEKKYKKLTAKQKEKVKSKLALFVENIFSPELDNHALHGIYDGYRSISLTGDIRMIYKILDSETILFVEIGKHSTLYK